MTTNVFTVSDVIGTTALPGAWLESFAAHGVDPDGDVGTVANYLMMMELESNTVCGRMIVALIRAADAMMLGVMFNDESDESMAYPMEPDVVRDIIDATVRQCNVWLFG